MWNQREAVKTCYRKLLFAYDGLGNKYDAENAEVDLPFFSYGLYVDCVEQSGIRSDLQPYLPS